MEASERVKVATKLLKTAKKLSVKAKAAQLKHLEEHKLPKDKMVSEQGALQPVFACAPQSRD